VLGVGKRHVIEGYLQPSPSVSSCVFVCVCVREREREECVREGCSKCHGDALTIHSPVSCSVCVYHSAYVCVCMYVCVCVRECE